MPSSVREELLSRGTAELPAQAGPAAGLLCAWLAARWAAGLRGGPLPPPPASGLPRPGQAVEF